jgi:hypothetical protein
MIDDFSPVLVVLIFTGCDRFSLIQIAELSMLCEFERFLSDGLSSTLLAELPVSQGETRDSCALFRSEGSATSSCFRNSIASVVTLFSSKFCNGKASLPRQNLASSLLSENGALKVKRP